MRRFEVLGPPARLSVRNDGGICEPTTTYRAIVRFSSGLVDRHWEHGAAPSRYVSSSAALYVRSLQNRPESE